MKYDVLYNDYDFVCSEGEYQYKNFGTRLEVIEADSHEEAKGKFLRQKQEIRSSFRLLFNCCNTGYTEVISCKPHEEPEIKKDKQILAILFLELSLYLLCHYVR